MRPLTKWISIVALCIIPPLTGCGSGSLQPVHIADLDDLRINESSGVAASRLDPNIIWMHNDSGDDPVLYATDARGENLGRFVVEGADARDWEDMCSFTLDGRAYLLVADVGNNRRDRDPVPLYLVPERPLKTAPQLRATKTIRIRFADGPHDCESVAFDPITRSLVFISKHYGQVGTHCRVFTLPLDDIGTNRIHELEPITRLPYSLATAMDISPDGSRVAVLTYSMIRIYDRRDGENWANTFSRTPQKLILPGVYQFEAICFTHDGRSLILTSEAEPCPMWRYDLTGLDRSPHTQKNNTNP